MTPMEIPTLIMVHGLLGSLGYFQPPKRIVGAAILTPDLLGYGSERVADSLLLTLAGQAAFLTDYIEHIAKPPVWLLGHSMGGAIVMLLAAKRPDLVAGIINVEGNFTLRDAFWSDKIAAMSRDDWHDRYSKMVGDPTDWLNRSDITVTEDRLRWAADILNNQPAETIQAMSRAIVLETGLEDYSQSLKQVVASGVPIHLVAGQRSEKAWDVPAFVREIAHSYQVISSAGHMMMLEQPDEFCKAVTDAMEN